MLATLSSAFHLEVSDEDEVSVLSDRTEGERLGVIGSPHFFTPAGDYFCPALDISRDGDGHLEAGLNTERFDEFIRGCMA